MKEADLHRAIMLAATRDDSRLFRNNNAQAWVGTLISRTPERVVLGNPRPLHAGLAVGSSDLIGVGPDGRFASIEVKLPGGRPTADQVAWLDMVRGRGGIAGVAHSVDEALAILGRR